VCVLAGDIVAIVDASNAAETVVEAMDAINADAVGNAGANGSGCAINGFSTGVTTTASGMGMATVIVEHVADGDAKFVGVLPESSLPGAGVSADAIMVRAIAIIGVGADIAILLDAAAGGCPFSTAASLAGIVASSPNVASDTAMLPGVLGTGSSTNRGGATVGSENLLPQGTPEHPSDGISRNEHTEDEDGGIAAIGTTNELSSALRQTGFKAVSAECSGGRAWGVGIGVPVKRSDPGLLDSKPAQPCSGSDVFIATPGPF